MFGDGFCKQHVLILDTSLPNLFYFLDVGMVYSILKFYEMRRENFSSG